MITPDIKLSSLKSNFFSRNCQTLQIFHEYIRLIFLVVLFFILAVIHSFSLSAFEEGEKLFLENKPEQALPYLEKALEEEPKNEKIYFYLGIIYEQLGRNEKAVTIMKLGLQQAGKSRDKLYFNMGNNYFLLEDYKNAEQMYTDAIRENPGMAEAYLNRANSRMKLESYKSAVEDYTYYLSLRPSAPQREEIERLVSLLKKRFEEEERKRREEELKRLEEERRKKEEEERRRLEEERRKEEERRRMEEERKRKEEEKRRQEELLRDVLESLQKATEETSSREAGSETIQDYEEELELKE